MAHITSVMAILMKRNYCSEAQINVYHRTLKSALLRAKDMLDFMELNPLKFYRCITAMLFPHNASGKVFGELSPDGFINDIKQN